MMEYPQYKKVLFCTDFSKNSDHAFEFAYGIAQRDGGLLYILHVIPQNPHQEFAESILRDEMLEEIQASIRENLAESFREHYEKKIDGKIAYKTVIKSGREDEEIVRFARQEKVDLIVIGTHGRTGIEHVFFGSVAEKVLRHSPFPVFVIPCKEKLECS